MLLFRSGYVLVYKKLVYLYLVTDEESWRLFIDENGEIRKKLLCKCTLEIMTDPLVFKQSIGRTINITML